MKKGLFSLIVLFSLLAVSCSDDDDDSAIDKAKNDIVGNWETKNIVGNYILYYSFAEDGTGVVYGCDPTTLIVQTFEKFSNYYIELNVPIPEKEQNQFRGQDKINRISFTSDNTGKKGVLYFFSLSETIMDSSYGMYKKVDKLNIVGL